jgi:hypothetical protein
MVGLHECPGVRGVRTAVHTRFRDLSGLSCKALRRKVRFALRDAAERDNRKKFARLASFAFVMGV